MRNRAKCKLCEEIIESLHPQDYVPCKCGEIAVDGGKEANKCAALHWENFLRIDDNDKIVEVKVIDATEEDIVINPTTNLNDRKRELVDVLKGYIDSFNRLPEHARSNFITHYDLQAALLVIYEVLNELCPSGSHLENK